MASHLCIEEKEETLGTIPVALLGLLIIFEYVNTKDNVADIFTKSLSKLQHNHILEGLQIEGACWVNNLES